MTAADKTITEAGTAGVSAAEFREAMGHFATGVAVVTSVGAGGQPVGTTANTVTSLSLDPPPLLVCFDVRSATLRAIHGHGAFVVNVLGYRQRHLSVNFARRGPLLAVISRSDPARPSRDGCLYALHGTLRTR